MNDKHLLIYKEGHKNISPVGGKDEISTVYSNDLTKLINQNESYAKYDNYCESCTGGRNHISEIINPLDNNKYLLNTIDGTKIIKYYIDFSLNKNNNTSYKCLIIDGKEYKTKSVEGLKKIIYLMNKYIKPTIKK
jgi:hypothetical protein